MSTTRRSSNIYKNTQKKHKNSINKSLLIFLLLSSVTLITVLIIYYNNKKGKSNIDNSFSISVDNILETSPAKPDYIKPVDIEYSVNNDDYEYPDSYFLDIPYISQYPELPTGCEITSLAEVLNYLGFNIDKETLARDYLDMKDTVTQGCFVEYFWGSPWKTTGSGCFAPAIANAANAFFEDNNSDYSAYIMSYQPVELLYAKLSQGHPVIVWTSFNYKQPEVTYNEVTLDDGTVFTWPTNEHCVALAGYDINKKTVTLADPAYGIVERDMEVFENYYKRYYYQAVVIE